jgi:hypothetical protein
MTEPHDAPDEAELVRVLHEAHRTLSKIIQCADLGNLELTATSTFLLVDRTLASHKKKTPPCGER